jgi:hypothetical protein
MLWYKDVADLVAAAPALAVDADTTLGAATTATLPAPSVASASKTQVLVLRQPDRRYP